MPKLFTAEIIGHAGSEPRVTTLNNGSMVASFSVAVDGTEENKPEWIQITLWNKLAESVAQYIQKGTLIYAAGRVSFKEWTNQKTGELVKQMEISSTSFQVLERRTQGEAFANQPRTAPSPAPANVNSGADDDVPF